MKRIIIGLVCGATVLLLATAAAGAIRIDKIYYDSPGADTGSNSSLNKEWIRLKNTGNSVRSLDGWKVRDRAGHVFKLITELPAGKTLKIHTGSGFDSAYPFLTFWGLDNYVWNNDGDKATLKKRNGNVADTCSYSGGGRAVNC